MPGLSSLHPAVQEALATHEVLRRCGFAAESIFVLHRVPPEPLFVVLRSQGKEFNISCGSLEVPEDQFKELWCQAARRFNAAPREDAQAMLDRTEVFSRVPELVAALVSKGFKVGAAARRQAVA